VRRTGGAVLPNDPSNVRWAAVDVLGDVFDDAVLNRLATLRGATTAQRERLAVLTARDVLPETDPRSGQLRYWRAKRSAWDVYLTAAAAVGLLDDDLKQRLGGDDDDGFRGAIGECLACWYLTGVPGLKISGRGQGRPGKLPDFHVVTPNGELTAEVKAPYEEPPRNATWSGDASDLVASVIDTANRQFGSDGPNLLILAPSLTFALSDMRYQAIKAFYGEYKIVVPINQRGDKPFDPRPEFFAQGKFLKRWPEPRFTRIGAVLSIEEKYMDRETVAGDHRAWIEHRALILHNPHAPHRIKADLFHCPQFQEVSSGMAWSDGVKIMPG
jgi:hypothetical protein